MVSCSIHYLYQHQQQSIKSIAAIESSTTPITSGVQAQQHLHNVGATTARLIDGTLMTFGDDDDADVVAASGVARFVCFCYYILYCICVFVVIIVCLCVPCIAMVIIVVVLHCKCCLGSTLVNTTRNRPKPMVAQRF
jgi:hypothetical protein